MAPLFGTHAKNTTVTKLRGVYDMLDVLGWTPLSQRRQEASIYKIINGLAQVPFEGVLVEAYKGTRRKHSMKFRQIDHTISQSFFLKTISAWNGLLSMKLCHWLYLDQIQFKISVHPFHMDFYQEDHV